MFQIAEVKDTVAQKTFIRSIYSFYKNDPSFIAPLETEVENIFDPTHNSFFKHGICTRWLLYNDKKIVGRIAAFINHEKAKVTDVPTGGIGFFEFNSY